MTRAAILRRRDGFALAMAASIVAIVVYGFSHTVRDNLFAPPYPRPVLLYVHAVMFCAWLAVFAAQSLLVRSGRVDLHRRFGVAGLVLGALIPIMGVATAIVMAQTRLAHGEQGAVVSLPIPLWDMVCFSSTFFAAAALRRRPDWHRRLMLLATISLTAAAFGRIPLLDHAEWFYLGVDLLIVVALVRDWRVEGRVHAVYAWALPAFVVGQCGVAALRSSEAWLRIAATLFRT